MVFLLGIVLFSFPLLAAYSARGTVLGIPVVYACLFTGWALLIALIALAGRRDRD